MRWRDVQKQQKTSEEADRQEARSYIYLVISVALFSFGTGIVCTVLPLYAGRIGASPLNVGVLGLCYGLAWLLSGLPSGLLADNLGAKRLILCGMLVNLVACAVYSTAANLTHLAVARALEGLAWATWWCSVGAMVMHIAPNGRTGKAMGVVSTVYGLGFVAGSSMAGVLLSGFSHTFAFQVALLGTLAAAITFAFGVRVLGHHEGRDPIGEETSTCPSKRNRMILIPYTVAVCYSFVLEGTCILLPLYAIDILGSEVGVGMLMAVLWLGRVVAFTVAGILADRWGSSTVLLGSLTVAALSSFVIAVLPLKSLVFLASFAIGIGLGSVFPACVVSISSLVTPRRRGSAMGMFEALVGFGMMVGPIVGGMAAQHIAPSATYLLNGVVIIAVITFIIAARSMRHSKA